MAVDIKTKWPKWKMLRDYVITELEQAKYKVGDPLPSEVHLSSVVGISRNTVRSGITALENEGFVKKVSNKGAFISRLPENIQRKQKAANVFAIVLPELRRSLYPSVIEGFGYEASKKFSQTMIFNTTCQVEKQSDIVLQIIEKKIAGVALIPVVYPQTPAYQIRQLHNHGIPVVFCHRAVDNILAPFVGWDWGLVGQIAGQKLMEMGHKKIMYLSSISSSIAHGYEKGLRQALNSQGLDLSSDMVYYRPSAANPSDFTKDDTFFKSIMNSKDRPTAIFCNDDLTAEGIYFSATKQGMKIPDDLSLVGFGDIRRDTYIRSILSSVVIDETKLGERAMRILWDMLRKKIPMRSNHEVLLDLSFSGGQSIGPPPK